MLGVNVALVLLDLLLLLLGLGRYCVHILTLPLVCSIPAVVKSITAAAIHFLTQSDGR